MSKPKPIATLGAYSLLPPYDKYKTCRIEWYDKPKRQTVGLSTGTSDLQRAEGIFRTHHLTNTRGGAQTRAKDEPVTQALSRYWLQHVSKLASADSAKYALKSATEFFQDKTITEIDASTQQAWVTSMRNQGVSDASIRRWISVVWAAFNYAVTFNYIPKEAVPAVLESRHWGERTQARKRKSGDASRRELTPQELGRLCDEASRTESGLRYFILALGSAARPNALVRLTVSQYNPARGVLDLNPPGRVQNKKYHALIAVAPTLGRWLDSWEPRTSKGHYLSRRADQPISSKQFFSKYTRRSGVPNCVPYTLRHTVASWLSGHRVPKWERSHFLGHTRPDGNTTDVYSHCDPNYLRQCAAAVEELYKAVAPYTHVDLMRHQWDEQHTPDATPWTWIDSFLETDGPRLLAPALRIAPPRRPILGDAPGSSGQPDAAPARSDGGADALNAARPASEFSVAWHVRGTSSEASEK